MLSKTAKNLGMNIPSSLQEENGSIRINAPSVNSSVIRRGTARRIQTVKTIVQFRSAAAITRE